MIEISNEQTEVANQLESGNILLGGVGTGKTRAAVLSYSIKGENMPLYILTTAKKRDDKDWEEECTYQKITSTVTVDSWNNIKKYTNVKDSYFIFDEQRLVGNGVWVHSFYKIAKYNYWILLSATPGDTWSDYIPILVANKFYKNRSEFISKHIVYKPYLPYPIIDHYTSISTLDKYIKQITRVMIGEPSTKRIFYTVHTDYDTKEYLRLLKERSIDNKPIESAASLVYELRKVLNIHQERDCMVLYLINKNKKVIIFYNYNYELYHLRILLTEEGIPYKEYNGEKHEPLPTGDIWVYLVQYTAGCEGWNCIATDSMILYSNNYSHRIMEQAYGRIDRRNTQYETLHYFILTTEAPLDKKICTSLKNKKKFNEKKYVDTLGVST